MAEEKKAFFSPIRGVPLVEKKGIISYFGNMYDEFVV